MSDLKWEQPDSDGGTYSTSSANRPPHGRIPYVVEKRHDGFSLSVNLLVRGLDTPERARGVARSIQGTIDGDIELAEVDRPDWKAGKAAYRAEGVRLRSYEPCDPCKHDDHEYCTGDCTSMCCALDDAEKENERLLSVMQWMVSRKKLEKQHVKDRCWGLSSDSLVLNVFDPSFPLHEPSDPSDLMACVRTVAMAPEHFAGPLRIILDSWIDVVCGKYPDSTDEIAQAISEVLSAGGGATETIAGQESQARGTEGV